MALTQKYVPTAPRPLRRPLSSYRGARRNAFRLRAGGIRYWKLRGRKKRLPKAWSARPHRHLRQLLRQQRNNPTARVHQPASAVPAPQDGA